MIKKNDVSRVVLQCNGGENTGMVHSDIGVQYAKQMGREQEMILFPEAVKRSTNNGS